MSNFPGPHCHIGEGIYEYFDAPVQSVYAAVSKASLTLAGNNANHWRLFLVINHNSSIVLDMVKTTPENLQGVLGILLKPYAVTNTAIKVINLPLGSSTLTVRLLWNMLNSGGFLDYSYSPTGEGCRAWLANTVNVLETNHYLAPYTVSNVLWPVITRVWTDTHNGYPQEMQFGGFGTHAARRF